MRTRSLLLKSVILIVAVTPLFLGEVVRTYAWTVVLGNSGFVNATLRQLGLIERPIQLMFTELGVIIALVHVTLPVMVIMLAAALAHIDRDYERAAQSLGAGPVRAFLTVTLPLTLPGIIGGFLLAFAIAISAYATPAILGGPGTQVMATLIRSFMVQALDWALGSAMGAILLISSIALLLLTSALGGRRA